MKGYFAFCFVLQLLPQHCHSFTNWSSSSDRLGQLYFLQSIGVRFKTKCILSQNAFFAAAVKVSACLEDVIRLFKDC